MSVRQHQGEQLARLKVKTAQIFAQEKRFMLAHDILEATDHPNADQLLQRIIPHLPPTQPPPRHLMQWGRWLGSALFMLVVGIIIGRATFSIPETITLDASSPLELLVSTPQPAGVIQFMLPTNTIDAVLDSRQAQLIATNQAVQQLVYATETQRARLPTATPLAGR